MNSNTKDFFINDNCIDSDTETETESDNDLDNHDDNYYRDEEVFLGCVSIEELKLNKKIGGSRRPTIVSRPSILPRDNDDNTSVDDKDTNDNTINNTFIDAYPTNTNNNKNSTNNTLDDDTFIGDNNYLDDSTNDNINNVISTIDDNTDLNTLIDDNNTLDNSINTTNNDATNYNTISTIDNSSASITLIDDNNINVNNSSITTNDDNSFNDNINDTSTIDDNTNNDEDSNTNKSTDIILCNKDILEDHIKSKINQVNERKEKEMILSNLSQKLNNFCNNHSKQSKDKQKQHNISIRNDKLNRFILNHCNNYLSTYRKYIKSCILIQSIWKSYKAIKTLKYLKKQKQNNIKKENIKIKARKVLSEEYIPSALVKYKNLQNEYKKENAKNTMNIMINKWKINVSKAKQEYELQIKAEKRLEEVNKKQNEIHNIVTNTVPDVINIIKEKTSLDINPLQSVDDRLNKLKNARLRLRNQLENASIIDQNKSPNNNNNTNRINQTTENIKTNTSSDTLKLLQEKQDFLERVNQKRMALRQKLGEKITSKENTQNQSINVK